MVFNCIQCGKEYTSYKENSKFCSLECKKKHNNIPYKCGYCNKQIIVPKSKIDAIASGKRENIYCSRECLTNSQKSPILLICENCGKEYSATPSYSDGRRFCSRKCYEDFRSIKEKVCPSCGITFYPTSKNIIYCSKKCAQAVNKKRTECKCDYCGADVSKKYSEYIKNKKHYCSKECMYLSRRICKEDAKILRDNYGIIPTKDIQKMMSKEFSCKQINYFAEKLGICFKKRWSDEEVELLKSNYSKIQMSDLLQLLDGRTLFSIKGKATQLGLLSKYYIDSKYSKDEDEYIKENYLTLSNEELAKRLNRTVSGISQHMFCMGLSRPHIRGVYASIGAYVRNRNTMWRDAVRNECNYTCCVTGKRTNIVVHHIRGFNILLTEAINMTDFKINENFEEYLQKDLDNLVEAFLFLQDFYGEYCCVNEDIHIAFHDKYGYGNNTAEQWSEFIKNYKQSINSEAL